MAPAVVKHVPSAQDVVDQWVSAIVLQSHVIESADEQDWTSLWFGFVIGIGRPDLATKESYLNLGFPEEKKFLEPHMED
jgi:hypothetical protein